MTVTTLQFVRESSAARLYRNKDGQEKWFPRSVIHRTTKFPPKSPGELALHTIELDEWFLVKNPWPAQQKELL